MSDFKSKYVKNFIKNKKFNEATIEEYSYLFELIDIDQYKCETCKNELECKLSSEYEPKIFKTNSLSDYIYTKCPKGYVKKVRAIIDYWHINPKIFAGDINISSARSEFFKLYYDILEGKSSKGIYVYGCAQSGKSYLINHLICELNKESIFVYFPKLAAILKQNRFDYEDIFEELINCEVLVLDDLGSELIDEFIRDEILALILRYRSENNLLTFITSIYDCEELRKKYRQINSIVDSESSNKIVDKITTMMRIVRIEEKI